jgi:hypothetical protein
MTRVVGKKDRSEFVLDPVEAWHRGRELDRLLAQALPPHPRGVFRGTHAEFARRDALRSVQIARRLNLG